MKAQGWLFLGCAAFFLGADVVYWFWTKSHSPTHTGEWTGTTALAVSVLFAFMIGFYLVYTARRIGIQPEDNKVAEVSDGAGEIGFYSPHSWWPLFVVLAASVAFVGFIIAWWLFLLGIAMTLMATIGFVFQYYRGQFAH